MKLFYLLFTCLFITGCATSQWAMRNATDNKVRTTEKISGINHVSLTDKHLLIDVNTKHTSSLYNKDDNKKLCFDRIAFSPNTKENIIPIHSSTFVCPQGIKSRIKEKLTKGPNKSLIIRFQKQEEIYSSKESIFYNNNLPILLSLKDGFKSKKLVRGNKLYYALMPFTFVFDIITAPIQWGIYFYEVRKMNMKHKRKKQ